MLRALALIFTLVAAGATPSGAAPADSLQETFALMDQASGTFRGLTAEIKQLSHTAVINEDSVNSGNIVVKRPKPHEFHVLINFEKPDPRKVMIAGTKVDLFYPKTNQVQEYDLGKAHKSQVEQFILLGFGSNSKDLRDAFTVGFGGPETVAGQPASRLELIPKSKDLLTQFPKIELWISDRTGISIQQKAHQPGGDYTVATYTNMKLSANIPDSEVKLDLPRGVQKTYPQK